MCMSVVELQNALWTNHTPPQWYCTIGECLPFVSQNLEHTLYDIFLIKSASPYCMGKAFQTVAGCLCIQPVSAGSELTFSFLCFGFLSWLASSKELEQHTSKPQFYWNLCLTGTWLTLYFCFLLYSILTWCSTCDAVVHKPQSVSHPHLSMSNLSYMLRVSNCIPTWIIHITQFLKKKNSDCIKVTF